MLAEINRKEWAFRQEKKRWDDERKTASQKDAERAGLEEKWKQDPQALLEAHGHSIDAVIDFFAKGGADSPEGRVRALESKLERRDREERERAEKAEKDNQENARAETRAQAIRQVHGDVAKLITEDRFEFCAAEESIADEVVKVITGKWEREGIDISVEDALALCESVLDRKADRLAQSKKLKAKLSPPAQVETVKPDASRQNTQVPSATPKRTITIKNRQQAVAPIRKPTDGRASRIDVVNATAANLGKLFAR
jgi:hypothetical protein